MTSPYLIADEATRAMCKALDRVPCVDLGSNRARQAAYLAADIEVAGPVLGNVTLDHEALKRQRIRRRQFGITVFAIAVVGSVQQAAAAAHPIGLMTPRTEVIKWLAILLGLWLAILLSMFGFVMWVRAQHRKRRPPPGFIPPRTVPVQRPWTERV